MTRYGIRNTVNGRPTTDQTALTAASLRAIADCLKQAGTEAQRARGAGCGWPDASSV